MQGYQWAKTPEDELFVVLMVDGKGYIPGMENAIDLGEVFFLGPVQWPTETTLPSRNLPSPNCGGRAPAAMRECVILPFAANG